MEIQKTFSKKIVISCSCGIQDILDYAKNPDEVYLEFLSRYDAGKISDKSLMIENLKQEGIVKDENEIKKMIGKNKPDEITKSVLFSKKDFVSHYMTIKNPQRN